MQKLTFVQIYTVNKYLTIYTHVYKGLKYSIDIVHRNYQ